MSKEPVTDWGEWSRAAVALMDQRNQEWIATFQLTGAPYHWHLDPPALEFKRPFDYVQADLCCIGSVSQQEDSFLWSWANDSIPPCAKVGIDRVRAFGQRHGLSLLATASWQGGRAEGLEMLALSGRILNADGVWIAPGDDVTMFFALSDFRCTNLSEFESSTGGEPSG